MVLTMELDPTEENFVKMEKILIVIVARFLRGLFMNSWDSMFPATPWTNDNIRRQRLFNAIKKHFKSCDGHLKKIIQDGDCRLWDISALCFVLLCPGLKLMDKCRPKNIRSNQLNNGEKLDRLREMRNKYFAHVVAMSISDQEFNSITAEIKAISKNLFGTSAESKIDQVISSTVTTSEYHALMKKYAHARRCNKNLELAMEGDLKAVKSDVSELQRDTKGLSNESCFECAQGSGRCGSLGLRVAFREVKEENQATRSDVGKLQQDERGSRFALIELSEESKETRKDIVELQASSEYVNHILPDLRVDVHELKESTCATKVKIQEYEQMKEDIEQIQKTIIQLNHELQKRTMSRGTSNSQKKQMKSKLSRNDIGKPENFRHVYAIRCDPVGKFDTADPLPGNLLKENDTVASESIAKEHGGRTAKAKKKLSIKDIGLPTNFRHMFTAVWNPVGR